MGIAERLPLYRELEILRGRPVIVYVTSSRPNASGKMAGDAIPELLDQLMDVQAGESIDLLVVSQGGDPTVAWRAISLIRERFARVDVLVPQAAFSAATLLALGADEIVMHPNGNLGPVDPQVTVKKKHQGSDEEVELRFGYEELVGFLEFMRQEVGLKDQEHLRPLLELICKDVGTIPVGIAARGSLLSVTMGEKLLRMHMKDEADAQKARAIAEALNKKFFHHGYPVSRSEAIDIGLKVAERNTAVEDIIWKIWLDIEQELKTRIPFDPIAELANSPVASLLFKPVPQINLPLNLPPSVLNQILPSILQQIGIDQLQPVDISLVTALCESPRRASRFQTNAKILACRMPDLQLRVNMMKTEEGWIPVAVG